MLPTILSYTRHLCVNKCFLHIFVHLAAVSRWLCPKALRPILDHTHQHVTTIAFRLLNIHRIAQSHMICFEEFSACRYCHQSVLDLKPRQIIVYQHFHTHRVRFYIINPFTFYISTNTFNSYTYILFAYQENVTQLNTFQS